MLEIAAAARVEVFSMGSAGSSGPWCERRAALYAIELFSSIFTPKMIIRHLILPAGAVVGLFGIPVESGGEFSASRKVYRKPCKDRLKEKWALRGGAARDSRRRRDTFGPGISSSTT